MKIFKQPSTMRTWAEGTRVSGKQIGLVPTMGALHNGHASLIERSIRENDVTVLSIFVNSTQFGENEDYDAYPKTWDADVAMATAMGVDALYAPTADQMYSKSYSTYVEVEQLQDGLCGKSRPSHFRGVTTVVAKLFNAILPHRAYFGQKDAQQCTIISRMVRDIDYGLEIVECPIIREPDGLALSTRNTYLSPQERERALSLSRALNIGKKMLTQGERDAKRIVNTVQAALSDVDHIDYVVLVNAEDLKPVTKVDGTILLAIAATVGHTRLIDNLKHEVDPPC